MQLLSSISSIVILSNFYQCLFFFTICKRKHCKYMVIKWSRNNILTELEKQPDIPALISCFYRSSQVLTLCWEKEEPGTSFSLPQPLTPPPVNQSPILHSHRPLQVTKEQLGPTLIFFLHKQMNAYKTTKCKYPHSPPNTHTHTHNKCELITDLIENLDFPKSKYKDILLPKNWQRLTIDRFQLTIIKIIHTSFGRWGNLSKKLSKCNFNTTQVT